MINFPEIGGFLKWENGLKQENEKARPLFCQEQAGCNYFNGLLPVLRG
jgi:hypothetical protein